MAATIADVAARAQGVALRAGPAALAAGVIIARAPLLPTAALLAAALLAITLAALAAADADLALLRRGRADGDAFTDKTVLVVGARRGLGAALAQHLCKAGAVLILAARNEADLLVLPSLEFSLNCCVDSPLGSIVCASSHSVQHTTPPSHPFAHTDNAVQVLAAVHHPFDTARPLYRHRQR